MNFFEKSLSTLELSTVLNKLSAEAISDGAKEQCLKIVPTADISEVSRRLGETSSACKMMVIRSAPPFSCIKDIRPFLSRADLGGTLNAHELLEIAVVLRSSRNVKAYVIDDSVGKTSIDFLFHSLHANKYLEEKINRSIISDDEISDSASSDLADIRRKMRATSLRAREALQKIITSPTYSRALQEPIITTRAERYVVPVKSEFRNVVPGLVHDISATGATLFVEPMAAVKANNELRELAAKEKIEIERILSELSAECASHAADIVSDYNILIQLDVIFAKAKLSFHFECCEAELSDKKLSLKKARHPLIEKDKAVPIDIELGDEFDTLIITGPNTGGKTVALKTIGLLSAMNQCGLHIPATDGSKLPVFSHILADIGDEQSIEQNLSTFSAHMTNIVNILEECNEKSLVLFDELGAGTDPLEGSALAVSIIEHVRKKGALIAATTHYTELKVYATNEEGVLNASCEFNVETLRPTYRILMGIPGKSNAFAISRRIGLNEKIIRDAESRVSEEGTSFEATIEKLELARTLLDRERTELAEKLAEARENARKSSLMRAELEVRLEKSGIKAKREAEQIIADAKKTAEQVFNELDEMKKHYNDEEDIQQINGARNELRRKLNDADSSLRIREEKPEDTRKSSRSLRKGDMVEIKSMGVIAEVLDVTEKHEVVLKAGMMNVTLKEDDVVLIDHYKKPKERKISKTSTVSVRSAGCPSEIDLRGMESIEAVTVTEQYIDNAVMARMTSIRIIHGKGTGTLRNAIHQMLRKNKNVKSFRLGIFGEGESGVTIAELK